MKTKVKATREKASDKKNKVQLRTLKAELDELQDEADELEELESLSKDEKSELKYIKRRINTVMKKMDSRGSAEPEQSRLSANQSVVHGGYGLSVMARQSGAVLAPRIGKMSVYDGGSII